MGSVMHHELVRKARVAAGLLYRWVHAWISKIHGRIWLKLWGAKVGRRLLIRGFLRLHNEGNLIIGQNVRIMSGAANFIGGDLRMAMWVGRNATLNIGDSCGLSNTTIVCLNSISILPETFIGGGCQIYDSDFHPIEADERIKGNVSPPIGEVTIGPKAFIGAFSIILKNVTIGEGAVVGAGSVVTKSVPPYEMWAGVPAKCVGQVTHATKNRG